MASHEQYPGVLSFITYDLGFSTSLPFPYPLFMALLLSCIYLPVDRTIHIGTDTDKAYLGSGDAKGGTQHSEVSGSQRHISGQRITAWYPGTVGHTPGHGQAGLGILGSILRRFCVLELSFSIIWFLFHHGAILEFLYGSACFFVPITRHHDIS